MRRLSAIFVVMFTVLLVATGAGASGAGANDEQGGRAKVLIIGDSVFDAFDHVASAREQLDSQQKTIFAVQGCQKLLEPGCMKWVKLSREFLILQRWQLIWL